MTSIEAAAIARIELRAAFQASRGAIGAAEYLRSQKDLSDALDVCTAAGLDAEDEFSRLYAPRVVAR